jgi:hypothetical protein
LEPLGTDVLLRRYLIPKIREEIWKFEGEKRSNLETRKPEVGELGPPEPEEPERIRQFRKLRSLRSFVQ